MQLMAQNVVCLIDNFNKDDLSIDSLRDVFGEMPIIQTPSFPLNINVPLPINLPTIIDFQSAGLKIVTLPDRIEINGIMNIQQNFPGKAKSFFKSIRKDYLLNAFGFNFDFILPCTSNLQQLMEINTKLTMSHPDTVISQIRYNLMIEDILYVIDFNENTPNFNIHINCHFAKPISIIDLTGKIEQHYDMCYQKAIQLIKSALGDLS